MERSLIDIVVALLVAGFYFGGNALMFFAIGYVFWKMARPALRLALEFTNYWTWHQWWRGRG